MNSVQKVARYWHTLKYLRPIQVYRRIWFRFYKPRLREGGLPTFAPLPQSWSAPIARPVSMQGANTFSFLNETRQCAGATVWNDPAVSKLWLYNLHYFDDLNAVDAASRQQWHRALLARWVEENLPTQGNGWEPYPTSLRIVNWLKYAWSGGQLPESCIVSLVLQVRWLTQRLEWHLLGNHLFANAKALVFAGLAYQGKEAQDWLNLGLEIIERELPEQVLPDGGNFERSTMYHAIFLEDILDLINAASAHPTQITENVRNQWERVAAEMLFWLEKMSHPDGNIAQFNDAAIDIAPSYSALHAYATRLGGFGSHVELAPMPEGVAEFLDSGYISVQRGAVQAFLDVAPVGPDYLPGHAHADTLSFELSVFGQRVIVNGGTSCYGDGAQRLRERQTCSHSTVEIDGESSSEVWGGFRVARRARPQGLSIEVQDDLVGVSCKHDGYARLKGRPIHQRQWQIDSHSLCVTDEVVSTVEHTAVARFVLHPMIRCEQVGDGVWTLHLDGQRQISFVVEDGRASEVQAWHAAKFGQSVPTAALTIALCNGRSKVRLVW